MEPNDVNINPTGVNFNLLNLERINLLLPLRGSSDQKLKQFFEFCKTKQTNQTEKDIIIKAIEACKSNEYTETRFLNIKGFSLMKRITKKIRITD